MSANFFTDLADIVTETAALTACDKVIAAVYRDEYFIGIAGAYSCRHGRGDLAHKGVCHNNTNRSDDQICVSGIDDHRIFAGGSIRKKKK